MTYDENIAQTMLSDQRWTGAINEKMLKVWRTRGSIPNHYFNPIYIKLIKEGKKDLANQIKDPFYNQNFSLKFDLSDEQKAEQKKLIEILSNPKIRVNAILKKAKVATNIFYDASRIDERAVDMRYEHIIAIKKEFQAFRIEVKKVIETAQGKLRIGDSDKRSLDKILNHDFVFVNPLVGDKFYAGRINARKHKKSSVFDDSEAMLYIDRLAIFLIETAF